MVAPVQPGNLRGFAGRRRPGISLVGKSFCSRVRTGRGTIIAIRTLALVCLLGGGRSRLGGWAMG
eukprot:6608128-Pyramimonas_sp.AAC.1